MLLFFFFFVIGTKELDHASKGNQFCLFVECVFLTSLLWSITSFCPFRHYFPSFILIFPLSFSIGLDIVNIILCCYCHSHSSQSCCTEMHDGMFLTSLGLCGPISAGRLAELGLYWFLLVLFLFSYDLTYKLCDNIRTTVWNSLRMIPDRNMPMTECV